MCSFLKCRYSLIIIDKHIPLSNRLYPFKHGNIDSGRNNAIVPEHLLIGEAKGSVETSFLMRKTNEHRSSLEKRL